MTVGILGLGLIGGSFARAFAKANYKVYAFDSDSSMLEFAKLAGAVHGTLDETTIPECDLIILCIYAAASENWLLQNSRYIAKSCLVTDSCGIKTDICKCGFTAAEKFGFTFVGCHPMAGSHQSGFKYSRSNLFQGAPMVIVPPRYDDPVLLQRVKEAFAPCCFKSFSVTSAREHDILIAFTSQMPHIISNAFIKSPTAGQHSGFSAGSYKDLTRVAWLNPQMWTELFLSNRDNLITELDFFIQELSRYKTALQDMDSATMLELLDEGKKRKEEVDG